MKHTCRYLYKLKSNYIYGYHESYQPESVGCYDHTVG